MVNPAHEPQAFPSTGGFVPRRVVRKAAQYFAASTRVLCGKYNPELRKAVVRCPQRDGLM